VSEIFEAVMLGAGDNMLLLLLLLLLLFRENLTGVTAADSGCSDAI
jgi:hypothetical protein